MSSAIAIARPRGAITLCTNLMLLLLVSGCAAAVSADLGSLKEAISRVRPVAHYAYPITENINSIRGRHIVTVIVDPEWDQVEVRDRSINTKGIICTETRYDISGKKEAVLYEVSDADARAMFESLHRLASRGYRYRSAEFERSSNPESAFVLTTGEKLSVGWNQGGQYSPVVCEACRFRQFREQNEPIPDSALADNYFGADVLSSEATLVDLSIDVFDELCLTAATSPHE